MDPSKFFDTPLFPYMDHLLVPRRFYDRWWDRLSHKVTIEDCVGNTFDCYPELIDDRPCLRTDITAIRRLYFIPHGGVMELKYVGRSRFRFKIPLTSDELLAEHEIADAASVVPPQQNDDAVSYSDHQFEYPHSDDDDDGNTDELTGLGGNDDDGLGPNAA